MNKVFAEELTKVQGKFHAIQIVYPQELFGQKMTRASALPAMKAKGEKPKYEFEFPVAISSEGNSTELAKLDAMPTVETWFLNIKTVETRRDEKTGEYKVSRQGRVKLVPGIMSECPVHGVMRIPAGNYAWKARKHNGKVRCPIAGCKEYVKHANRSVKDLRFTEDVVNSVKNIYRTDMDEAGVIKDLPTFYAAVKEPKALWDRTPSAFETTLCQRAGGAQHPFYLLPADVAYKSQEKVMLWVLSLPYVCGWIHASKLTELCGGISVEI